MEDSNNSIEAKNNNQRNAICQSLRTALASKSERTQVLIDRNIGLFGQIEHPLQHFKNEFSANGGKLVEFEIDKSQMNKGDYVLAKMREVYGYVNKEIEIGKYEKVLNVSPNLSQVFAQFNISCINSLPPNEKADAVIVYAEYLIARSGSIAFIQSPSTMLYPSIRNLAPNVIVLASSSSIYGDMEQLLEHLKTETKIERKSDVLTMKFDMLEIVSPVQVENEEYTPENPHITIVMLVEQ
ncbi:MAG: lactate utilization protein [Bacteroidales bacterium]|jgi:L-lactate utilization protein LutC|nr:lactate utilization protein [Bacteroidales bacterium]